MQACRKDTDYYDGENDTGDLEEISYSDATPSVTFSYTRSGRPESVLDAVGTRTFAYQANDKWRKETFDPNSIYGGMELKATYKDQATYQVGKLVYIKYFLRLSQLEIGTAADPDAYYLANYDYDQDNDWMKWAKGPGLPSAGANYSYLADSRLVEQVDYKAGSTLKGRVTRSYETSRDLLTSVQNEWGSPLTTVSKYTYANDELGRREWVYRYGTAFGGDHADVWGYNARNELTSSERYGTFDPQDPNNPSDPNAALDRTYAYDPIGNRTDYTEGTADPLYYCANELNQYEHTDDETGTCPNPATPTESFSYDEDGNLTQDGTYDYTWDAENRLIRVEPDKDPNDLVQGDKKLAFRYDYLGRRVEKKVYTHNGTSWDLSTTRRFMYYNWLPLLELDVTNPGDPNEAITVLRKYTWGLDLAGLGGSMNSLAEAGGIGGLLATYDADSSKSYAYFYDANGNVGQLIDRSDGSIDAKYEYDAYGNTTASGGPYADDNPFRFSTKYFDGELDYADTTNDGLYYFGYRYYSPRLGRWLARDPIGEAGNVNVYGFLRNRATSGVDALGQQSSQPSSRPASAGCCGPDITARLNGLIDRLAAAFRNKKPREQMVTCLGMTSVARWDIDQLAHSGSVTGFAPFEQGACGSGKCQGTIQVNGTCYNSPEVNYYLWGKAHALCRASLSKWATRKCVKGGYVEFGGGAYAAEESCYWRTLDGRALPEDIFTCERAAGIVGSYRRWFGIGGLVAGQPLVEPGPRGHGSTQCRKAWTLAGCAGGSVPQECVAGDCGTECCAEAYDGSLSGHIFNLRAVVR